MDGQATPIRRKLMTIMLLTSGLVLLVTSAAFLAYEAFAFRQTSVQQLATLGQVISANSTASLAFVNLDDATETLDALRVEPHVAAAALYDAEGRIFARYPKHLPAEAVPDAPGPDGYRFERSHLIGFVPVVEGGNRRLGTLYLQQDLGAMYERLRLYGGITGLVMVGALLVAYVLSLRLQRQISTPILALAETAKAISVRGDYSVRAPKGGADELGLLTDAFNQMLDQIHSQNETLIESEGRLRSVLDAALSAVIVTDAAGLITDWSARAETMFEVPASQALGQSLVETILPPGAREAYAAAVVRSLGVSEGILPSLELNAWGRSRVEFPVELAVSPLKGGASAGYCCFITDITERRQAEALRQAVTGAEVGTWHWNIATGELRWSDRCKLIFGIPLETIMSHERFLEALHPLDRARTDEAIRSALERRDEYEMECRSVWADGSVHWVVAKGHGHYDAAGNAVRMEGVALDISRRKASEEALRVLHEQLQASNQELQAFGYSVSHDLRSPLRGIDGWSLALMEDYADRLDERGRGYLELVRSETQRMGQLIDDLLHLSRVNQSAMHSGPVDLSALAEGIATRLKPLDRTVEICIQPGLEARGDAGLLRVALTNLLENAFKFSGKQPAARIEFGRMEDGVAPVYFVRDNGAGFDMAYAEHLFAPFQRMHRASEFPGTGIGLATVQRVIARHGGRIWVDAQVEQGATFFFSLESTS